MCERGAYEDDARILVFRGEILEPFFFVKSCCHTFAIGTVERTGSFCRRLRHMEGGCSQNR
jgi:hypothetical protein